MASCVLLRWSHVPWVHPWPPDWNGSRSGCRERPSWQRARKLLRWSFWKRYGECLNIGLNPYNILQLPTTIKIIKHIYFRREGLGFALCICKNEAKSPVAKSAKSCHSSHDHQAVVIDSSLVTKSQVMSCGTFLNDVEIRSLGDILLFLIEAAEATHLRITTGFPTLVIHQTILITSKYI